MQELFNRLKNRVKSAAADLLAAAEVGESEHLLDEEEAGESRENASDLLEAWNAFEEGWWTQGRWLFMATADFSESQLSLDVPPHNTATDLDGQPYPFKFYFEAKDGEDARRIINTLRFGAGSVTKRDRHETCCVVDLNPAIPNNRTCVWLKDGTKVVLRRSPSGHTAFLEVVPSAIIKVQDAPKAHDKTE